MFCPSSPTAAGGARKDGVASLRDNEASSPDGGVGVSRHRPAVGCVPAPARVLLMGGAAGVFSGLGGCCGVACQQGRARSRSGPAAQSVTAGELVSYSGQQLSSAFAEEAAVKPVDVAPAWLAWRTC
jgi:hypothetical protein